MAGERTLLTFHHILRNYDMPNGETGHKYLWGERCILVYHFQLYLTLETKSEFGATRAEKGVEDNFPNEHPILIK